MRARCPVTPAKLLQQHRGKDEQGASRGCSGRGRRLALLYMLAGEDILQPKHLGREKDAGDAAEPMEGFGQWQYRRRKLGAAGVRRSPVCAPCSSATGQWTVAVTPVIRRSYTLRREATCAGRRPSCSRQINAAAPGKYLRGARRVCLGPPPTVLQITGLGACSRLVELRSSVAGSTGLVLACGPRILLCHPSYPCTAKYHEAP